jgi:DNA modification methylase
MTPYYSDDLVTIYHADCRDFMPVADVIVTDPPYGMAYRHGARKGGFRYGQDEQTIVGDQEPFDPAPILALALPTVLFGANHYADRLPPSKGWLVWDKRAGSASNDQSDCELAWSNVLTTARLFSVRWSGAHRQGREQQDGRDHPNQKPVALMAWVLGFVPHGTVLDPFMGSGSTLVAAKNAGRRAIGVEIDEAHCARAAERCSQEVLGLVG